jgi:hypothetical protein
MSVAKRWLGPASQNDARAFFVVMGVVMFVVWLLSTYNLRRHGDEEQAIRAAHPELDGARGSTRCSRISERPTL